MAKTKVNTEDDEVKVMPETSTEETTGQDAVMEEATISTSKKTVKIHTVEDVDCLISCKPYKITKDKDVTVPSDVAAILCYAKKAYRI